MNRIKSDISFIVKNMKNVDLQELNDNEILLDSMLFRMIQISESVKRLSADYKDATVICHGMKYPGLEIG